MASRLTNAQLTALGNHIKASSNPVVVAARNVWDDVAVLNEYNLVASPARKVWRVAMDGLALWDAMVATQFDGISVAPKRELWLKMLDIADRRPFDMSMAKNRNIVGDIWVHLNSTQLNALYAKLTESATVFEAVFTITDETIGTTTAGDRAVVGPAVLDDISDALNRVGRPPFQG